MQRCKSFIFPKMQDPSWLRLRRFERDSSNCIIWKNCSRNISEALKDSKSRCYPVSKKRKVCWKILKNVSIHTYSFSSRKALRINYWSSLEVTWHTQAPGQSGSWLVMLWTSGSIAQGIYLLTFNTQTETLVYKSSFFLCWNPLGCVLQFDSADPNQDPFLSNCGAQYPSFPRGANGSWTDFGWDNGNAIKKWIGRGCIFALWKPPYFWNTTLLQRRHTLLTTEGHIKDTLPVQDTWSRKIQVASVSIDLNTVFPKITSSIAE